MIRRIWKHRMVLVPVTSLLTLMLVAAYFAFPNNPPNIGVVLGVQKEAAIRFELPSKVPVNMPFDVDVIIDSQKQNVNAVGLYLHYNPEHLQLIDFDTSESFCQFYPEKKFDNTLGTLSLSCGSPHPGFSGQNKVIKLTFMPRLVTTTVLSTDPKSRILLSNGKGTNILTEHPQHDIRVLNNL